MMEVKLRKTPIRVGSIHMQSATYRFLLSVLEEQWTRGLKPLEINFILVVQ